uniref:ABM domain-containing protein n=1 Tax=Neobodo designis TaxID=312471 RepID=A0A7S1MSW5_NEODS
MVHGLLVRVVVKDPAFIDATFVPEFSRLYWHSNAAEKDTLTYELHRPEAADSATDAERDEASRTLVILERYTNAAALKDVHNHSEPFKGFGAWIGEMIGAGNIASVKVEHLEEIAVPKPAADSGEAEKAAADAPAEVVAATGGDPNGILVFAGARPGEAPLYMQHAEEVGQRVAALGRRLVYGGGTVGVMGAVASAADKAGGKVLGVIPAALAPREASGAPVGEVVVVDTMSKRKDIMFSNASWLVVCPGGIGTLDEFFEVLTLCQLNAYRCRVGLLNTENFFGPLLAMMRHLVAQKFLEAETVDALVVRNTPGELFEAMESANDLVAVGFAKNLKW